MRSPRQSIPGWSGDREGVVLMPSRVMEGRLSLTSATPVTTSDVTAATALYYTEYTGNLVTLPYRVGKWEQFELPKNPSGVHEISANFLANSPWALANATAYDVFLALGQDGPKLVRGPAWSSATARAAALARHDGVLVLGLNPLWVYVGTIYASAANQCEDSAAKRFVWNMANRVLRHMSHAPETTNSWTYTTATWRQSNANTANQVMYVVGLSTEAVKATAINSAVNSAAGIWCPPGVGVDVTNANSAQVDALAVGGANIYGVGTANYLGYPGIGYHYLAWLELSFVAGTTTFNGDFGTTYMQCGLTGEVWA